MRALPRLAAPLAAAFVLASCSGGGYSQPQAPPPPPPPSTGVDFADAGMAVVKVRSSVDGVTVLEEKLTGLRDTGPQRRLTLLDTSGGVRARYSPPEGFSLIDFAQHPSGQVTVALASARAVTLARLDHAALPTFEYPLLDAQAANDPFYDSGGVHDDTSMVPIFTRDAVRVAPIGDDVAVALRTGRNAVVAYRLAFGVPGTTGFAVRWRTLVEPGVSMFGIGITSGSFDTFGQLENHFHVHMDADAAGNVAVAVAANPASAPIVPAHADYFHQPVAMQFGVLVTRLSADGQRTGTTPVDTLRVSELHGLKITPNGVALVGRVFTQQRDDGSGWDAFVANVDPSSGFYRVIDVDRGDALFDIASADAGRYIVGGTTGYTQNPTGASISEPSAPLLLLLEADGSVRRRIDVTAGPRQNQVRSIAARASAFVMGGLTNGPGTHSGDADPSLIFADGFARDLANPAP